MNIATAERISDAAGGRVVDDDVRLQRKAARARRLAQLHATPCSTCNASAVNANYAYNQRVTSVAARCMINSSGRGKKGYKINILHVACVAPLRGSCALQRCALRSAALGRGGLAHAKYFSRRAPDEPATGTHSRVASPSEPC
jgi:hypothetical protein